MINLKNLTIGYIQNNDMLKQGISLNLFPNELTSLIGSNGVGKSTLIKTIAGIIEPLEGEIIVDNVNINKYRINELSKKISIVLTERSQLMNLSVFELVASGRHPYTGFFGKLKSKDITTIEQSIQMVGIKKLIQRKCYELSDGELQKVMIAKALAQETPIILLDEPTAFLDINTKYEIMGLLHDLANNNAKTILLSTHDLELAMRFADKLWLMNNKDNIVTGNTEDIVLNDDISNFFTNENIIFDKLSGRFNIKKPMSKEVKLSGECEEQQWLVNALSRNGFSISQTSEIEIIMLNHGSRQYILKTKDDENLVDSIENLLSLLKKL